MPAATSPPKAQPADESGLFLHVDGGRIDLRTEQHVGDRPRDDDQRRLPAALDADAMGVAGGHDQHRADDRRDQRLAEQHRSVGIPELLVDRIGDEGDGGAAHHQEAHDAEIEQPAIAPLDVEAERDQRVGGSFDQHAGGVGGAERHPHRNDQHHQRRIEPERAGHRRVHVEAPLKMPVGRASSTMTRMTKATVSLYSVGTSASPELIWNGM